MDVKHRTSEEKATINNILENMGVQDVIEFPIDRVHYIRARASEYGMRTGRVYRTRTFPMMGVITVERLK